jgi:hypothetical protein
VRWSGRVAGVDSVGALGLLVGGRLSANERTNLLVGALAVDGSVAANERTNPLVGALWGRGLCERTNLGVRALFVRSHRSQGMGWDVTDPFVRLHRFAEQAALELT